AEQILENPYGDTSGGPRSVYLNPAAFRRPPSGTLASTGVNNIQGPRTWQFDTALSRIFQFSEDRRMEARAEAYNITNSFRPGNPVTGNVTAATFGQITTSDAPRIMQFALKYYF